MTYGQNAPSCDPLNKNASSYLNYINVMISSISLVTPGSGAPRCHTLSTPAMNG